MGDLIEDLDEYLEGGSDDLPQVIERSSMVILVNQKQHKKLFVWYH